MPEQQSSGVAGVTPTIDPRAVLRELGVREQAVVKLLATNREKGVWKVELADATYALRVLRPGEHATSQHEQLAMGAARAAGLPVPEVHATATWQERPVMLMSWYRGRTLKDEVRARPWAAYHLGLVCGRSIAELHQVLPPPKIAELRWETRFADVDSHLLARLQAVQPATSRLLHLDLSPTNIIVRHNRLEGIIDWTNSCAGDPRADLARTWSLLAASGGRTAIKAAKRLLMHAWHRGYEEVAGPQTDMLLFRIWAMQALLRVSRRHASRYGHPDNLSRWRARVAEMRARAGLPPP